MLHLSQGALEPTADLGRVYPNVTARCYVSEKKSTNQVRGARQIGSRLHLDANSRTPKAGMVMFMAVATASSPV